MNQHSFEPLPSGHNDRYTPPVPPLQPHLSVQPTTHTVTGSIHNGGQNTGHAFHQTIDITDSYDDDVEDFPGGTGYHGGDDEGKEDFPGGNGDGRTYSIQSSDYGSGKESFLGGSTSNYSKQSQEEFPGGSSAENYGIHSSLNGRVTSFAVHDENAATEAATPSFYALDGDRINLRPSFVHVEQHMPPPPSRTRNSLYHPDLETCRSIDRRRSSIIATKILDQLHKLDEALDEDSESEEEEVNRDFRPKRKLSTSEALSHFRGSLRQSLTLGNIDEIFDPRPETKRADRRKSTRMSLLLRQSLISSWANITDTVEDDSDEVTSRSIADLFNAKKDRRRSVITESSSDLLKKVFGNEKGDIPPGCEKDVLKEILDPHSTDILMTSVLSATCLEDSLALLRAEYENDADEEDENPTECSNTPLNVHMETGIMNLKMI